MDDQNIKTYKVGNLIIKIDRSRCISCAACTSVAPKTFELDDELISVVKNEGPYDDESSIREAEAGCAGGAIVIEKTVG